MFFQVSPQQLFGRSHDWDKTCFAAFSGQTDRRRTGEPDITECKVSQFLYPCAGIVEKALHCKVTPSGGCIGAWLRQKGLDFIQREIGHHFLLRFLV